jgi:ABC-type tungstate transport system substrate-binding protein
MSAEKSTFAAYSASGSLTVFGMLMNDLALIVGMLFALLTFVLNWYYRHQELKAIERRVSAMKVQTEAASND